MRVIDVLNKANSHMRLVAKDEQEAIDISFNFGLMRKKENAKTRDITEHLLQNGGDKETLRQILREDNRGQLIWQGISYKASEIFSSDFEKIKAKLKKQHRIGYVLEKYIFENGKWTINR